MADTFELRCNGCRELVKGWTRIGPGQYVHASHPVSCVDRASLEGYEAAREIDGDTVVVAW